MTGSFNSAVAKSFVLGKLRFSTNTRIIASFSSETNYELIL